MFCIWTSHFPKSMWWHIPKSISDVFLHVCSFSHSWGKCKAFSFISITMSCISGLEPREIKVLRHDSRSMSLVSLSIQRRCDLTPYDSLCNTGASSISILSDVPERRTVSGRHRAEYQVAQAVFPEGLWGRG